MAAPSQSSQSSRPTQPAQEIVVVGARGTSLRDIYYQFLRVRWSFALSAIVVGYLILNAIFAVAYLVCGGITNARPQSFFDAFCFSVQTMGTIGYGAMYPSSVTANAIMIVESVTSLIVTALATGLVFAKFSRATARVAFSKHAVIGPIDGVPTLSLRVGNERGNTILEATVRLSIVRTQHTKEGVLYYRLYDLRLSRERSAMISRSWTVFHPIDSASPLFGITPEQMVDEEIELVVTLIGLDDTSMQPVHARKRYLHDEILWGARHVDILTERDDGALVLDVRKFHGVTPTEPTDEFPYRHTLRDENPSDGGPGRAS
jgi:inward rectifier potassium channel